MHKFCNVANYPCHPPSFFFPPFSSLHSDQSISWKKIKILKCYTHICIIRIRIFIFFYWSKKSWDNIRIEIKFFCVNMWKLIYKQLEHLILEIKMEILVFFLQSISKLERFILQTWITSLIISDRQSLDNDKRVSMFYYYLK